MNILPNHWRITRHWRSTWVVAFAFIVAAFILVPESRSGAQHEQTIFGIESEIERAVTLPKSVVNILRKDARVSECLKREGLAEPSASMFVASEVHLHSGRQTDLVVLPKDACLFGANIGPIWVFRNSPGGYQLIFKTDALGIEVLRERSNGYRNILGSQATARKTLTATFKFDGNKYQQAR